MKKLKSNEFQCAQCGNVFEKEWTDEEAKQECRENFGEIIAALPTLISVCDDCYNEIQKKFPNRIQECKERFFNKT